MIDWDELVLAPLEGVFGEGEQEGRIQFHPFDGEPYDIDGIYDAAYRDAALVDPMVSANTTQPILGVRLSIFRAAPVPGDDQVYIPRAGKMFLVKEVRPDSHGGAKLMLGEM